MDHFAHYCFRRSQVPDIFTSSYLISFSENENSLSLMHATRLCTNSGISHVIIRHILARSHVPLRMSKKSEAFQKLQYLASRASGNNKTGSLWRFFANRIRISSKCLRYTIQGIFQCLHDSCSFSVASTSYCVE